MSKINQIQNALKEIDGGKFQKLCDSYLKQKGHYNLNPLGSVFGANKVRKGTPDTFIRQEDERIVEGTPEEIAGQSFEHPNVVILKSVTLKS